MWILKTQPRLSLIANFRDSLKDLQLEDNDHYWMIKTLVDQCNLLSELGNHIYGYSGPSLSPPLYGKISLEDAVVEADFYGCNNQWKLVGGRVPKVSPVVVKASQLKNQLKGFNNLVLSTDRDFNNLVLNTDLVLTPNALMPEPMVGEKFLLD